MKFHELVVLLPCHGLEDFPFHLEGPAASNLLASYTASWHPALLAEARRRPTWRSAYAESEELGGKLVVVPRVCRDDLPGYWAEEARAQGALVLETSDGQTRDEMVAGALSLVDCSAPPIEGAMVADFFALGLCHLLLELLTVQMRYSSLVDDEHFSRQLVAAADAALEGDGPAAHEKLALCFDALSESRGHFYPVDAYLVDLTLLAPTTLGPALRAELARGVPINVLLEGSVLAEMAAREPKTLAALREAVAAEAVSIVGGEAREQELPLLPVEAVLANFVGGLALYEQFLGARPRIFGRRRFGLSPSLPQVLEKLNFAGGLHFTLDDGHFPPGRQSMFRWEGRGAAALDVLARVPLEAAKPESILALPQHMASAMDLDHVATVVFAHWPGHTNPWYEDLQRCAAFAPVLGRFITLENLFNEADLPGQLSHFPADQYRSPYLVQQVAAGEIDPLSRHVRAHAAQVARDAVAAIDALATLLRGAAAMTPGNLPPRSEADPATSPAIAPTTDPAAELPPALSQLPPALSHVPTALARFAAALPGGGRRAIDVPAAVDGYLVVNPLSFGRRVVVATPDLDRPPASGPPIYAAGEVGGRREVVVDLPASGYAWIEAGAEGAWAPPPGKPLAEDLVLRNEFFEVTIDPQTGAIQSIFIPGHRGNRFSQQLSLRRPGGGAQSVARGREDDDQAEYSGMAVERVETTLSGPATGEIVSRGRLLDLQGEAVATFSQTTRVERGSRVIGIDVELEPLVELAPDPWQHYFAARFAWADESAELYRDVGLVAERAEARRLEALHYLDLRGARFRAAILCGGLAYHRRVGARAVDTLLVVRGETARRFRLGIGLDLTHPLSAALELLAPATVLRRTGPPPVAASSWLFHIDARNVLATHWEPRLSEGRVVGLRVRLLETAGRGGRCGLHSYRAITAARRLDFLGCGLSELQPERDKVLIDFAPGEWLYLELDF